MRNLIILLFIGLLFLLTACGNPYFETDKAKQCGLWLCEREGKGNFEVFDTIGIQNVQCQTEPPLQDASLRISNFDDFISWCDAEWEKRNPQPKVEQPQEKQFNGRYNEQMPQLIKEGFQPMTAQNIMRVRLEGRHLDAWVDTADAIAYSGDGKFKIIRDSETLRRVDENTKLENGAIALTKEQYDAIDAQEFSINEIQHNEWLSKQEVLDNPVWLAFADGDKKLLKRYADMVFSKSAGKNMAIWLSDPDTPQLRPWYLNRLDGRGSGAGGRDRLDFGAARVLGVRRTEEKKEIPSDNRYIATPTTKICDGMYNITNGDCILMDKYCVSHPEDREKCECLKMRCYEENKMLCKPKDGKPFYDYDTINIEELQRLCTNAVPKVNP